VEQVNDLTDPARDDAGPDIRLAQRSSDHLKDLLTRTFSSLGETGKHNFPLP
jgi:hypothetical protein